MNLRMKFKEGHLHGAGEDRIGPFRIQGGYTARGRVRFTKVYPYHKVRYDGRWDGTSIAGQWKIEEWDEFDEGEFEIWPLKDDEERAIRLEELESTQTVETPQPVPALD